MKLRSSTWRGRNRKRLIELRDAAKEIGYSSPKIADIGVGGVTYWLGDLFPEGPRDELKYAQQVQRFFVRIADNLARKYDVYGRLVNYELGEMMDLFSIFNPSEVLVIDNDPRVLASVNGNGNLRKLNLDICESPIPDQMDILICYNVLQISSDPYKGLENLLDSVAEGGLLSLETNGFPVIVKDGRYERLTNNLYRKH